MKRKREVCLLLAILAAVALVEAQRTRDNAGQPIASSVRASCETVPKREAFLEFTFEHFCSHGTCGHNASWWTLQLDGQQTPPILVASELGENGKVTRSVKRQVSRTEFEQMLGKMVKLGLPQWKKFQQMSHYNPYFFVDTSLDFEVEADLTIYEVEAIGQEILDWFESEPAVKEIKAELNPKFSYCSR